MFPLGGLPKASPELSRVLTKGTFLDSYLSSDSSLHLLNCPDPLRQILYTTMWPFNLFSNFTRTERVNILKYAAGIMFYKFALEYFNGSFITIANERFVVNKYTKIAILTGINSAMQCIGSILIAPLIKRFPTRSVLASAVLTFSLISTLPLICDAATGGQLKFRTSNNKTKYGTWNPNGLFPIYIISGVAYGMVELIRRVIPRDIVGGDVQKLKRMDAVIHVLYEVAGTTGAFTSPSLITKFGYNYSAFLSPIFFACAAIVWRTVSDVASLEEGKRTATQLEQLERDELKAKQTYMHSAWVGIRSFGKAIYFGALLVTRDRKYIWLIPGYSIALYGHRYLENGLAPIFAKQVLGTSSWSQIIVGGSNFGELLGALSVLLTANVIQTPIPFLRLDALALNIVWILPFIAVTRGRVGDAWKVAACFIPISYGWAAGDVSLAAYIQSSLAKLENVDPDVSALGAVMAFLYVSYIVLYAVLSSVLGKWVDRQLAARVSAREILKYVGGVQFTVICVVVLIATLIPKGALALNPALIDGVNIENEEGDTESADHSDKDEKYRNEDLKGFDVSGSPTPLTAPKGSTGL
ncbi:Major facilitator superfamily domain, general substrate transporter [Phaffia rhodozyma]|uniref:Major facilitator superfamily domain, general substrate transporter n=1 Tax=Phaffia rhodozyma TaxID=264483 RepID=A0A0F7SGC8_PHARH|nr:Major facilitator superfamily domain, general substrate transporter [Phaffia rhodozyma]